MSTEQPEQEREEEATPAQTPEPDAAEWAALVRFGFELSQLRQETRRGWLRIHERPESVAEHSQRAAALGFFLAVQEGFPDPCRVATMIVFHDMHEARTGDPDRVLKNYLQVDEHGAAQAQMGGLGKGGELVMRMWEEVENGTTLAGRIAKDAEVLDMAFTARELMARGNTHAQAWIDSIPPRLRTNAARRLLPLVNQADPLEWWKLLR